MTMPDFSLASPEIFLLSALCTVLVVDLFLKPEQRGMTYVLAQISLLGTVAIIFLTGGKSSVSFAGSFIRDDMGDILKIAICLVSVGVFLYSRDYLRERKLDKGEYYVLGLFAVLGMMVMVSSYSLLMIYLGIELLSLSLYALVAFNRNSASSSEAAMKYFVLGAIASGMLLYGMSILYGLTGSLEIPAIYAKISREVASQGIDMALVFGLVFVLVGIAFKFGAVPFHMWVPDVYEGAPTPVALMISAAPKIAAFAMVIRVLVEGLGSLHADWQQMLVLLAILSIGLGNVVAIAQTNIKRMLAYSTISHVGFIFLGLLAGTKEGYAASMFYTITYAITSLGSFGVILLLSRKGFEAEQLADFKGLNERHPWYAFIMMILLASMIGIPGTAGFIAKLSVLEAVVRIDMIGLAIFAVILSVIGAYYYLRVIWYMYFEDAATDLPIDSSKDVQVFLSANGLLLLLLGIFPGLLMAFCMSSLGAG